MSKFLVALSFLMGFPWAHAQQPPPPPKPDIAPAPLPMEGQKKLVPGHVPKKGMKVPGAELPHKRPPVTPPTPVPTAPDEPQN